MAPKKKDTDEVQATTKLPSKAAFKNALVFQPTSGAEACQAAVIWLHGFGDRPEGWASALKPLRSLESTKLWKWVHMRAPLVAQPCFGNKKLPAWGQFFDQKCIHVGSRDYEDLDASGWYSASVDAVKHQVNILQQEGIPAERIVIGGFSQGAALALEAFLSMTTAVCGCIVLSGWLTPRSKAALSNKERSGAPVLLCHGTKDDMVGFDCAETAASVLKAAGCKLEFHQHKGMEHSSCPAELTQAASFLHERCSPGVVAPKIDWEVSDSQSDDESDDGGTEILYVSKISLEACLRRLQEGHILTLDILESLTDQEPSSEDETMVPLLMGSVQDVGKLLNTSRAAEASKIFIECISAALLAKDTHVSFADVQDMVEDGEEEDSLEDSAASDADNIIKQNCGDGASHKKARTM